MNTAKDFRIVITCRDGVATIASSEEGMTCIKLRAAADLIGYGGLIPKKIKARLK